MTFTNNLRCNGIESTISFPKTQKILKLAFTCVSKDNLCIAKRRALQKQKKKPLQN